ncbi:WhiB family transcriptional regulator [Rhodococcus fascians]|nr:WhiB family transcriptional regulator [Rhodococcus fascians]
MPIAELWDWQLEANCRGLQVRTFFPPSGTRGKSLEKIEQRAKSICAACPVRQSCLDHALECGEPYGVWGGLSPTERARLRSLAPSATEVESELHTTEPASPTHRIGKPLRPYLNPVRSRSERSRL